MSEGSAQPEGEGGAPVSESGEEPPAAGGEPSPHRPPQLRWPLVSTVLWSAALLAVGSVPAAALTQAPRVWDKLAHGVAYGLLGLLTALALSVALRGGELILTAAAWAVAVGALDEFHQLSVPGRSSSLLDLLADGLGAVAGASLVALWAARRHGAAPDRRDGAGPPGC